MCRFCSLIPGSDAKLSAIILAGSTVLCGSISSRYVFQPLANSGCSTRHSVRLSEYAQSATSCMASSIVKTGTVAADIGGQSANSPSQCGSTPTTSLHVGGCDVQSDS